MQRSWFGPGSWRGPPSALFGSVAELLGGRGLFLTYAVFLLSWCSDSSWRVNHASRLGHILYELRIGWVLHRLLAFPCGQLWHLCPCLAMSAPAPTLVACRGDPLGLR